MKVLSFNPGHDGAFAYLEDGHLVASFESEKDSRYRHSPVSVVDVFSALDELKEIPDTICRSGWWPGDTHLAERKISAGYHGVNSSDVIIGQKRIFGTTVNYFSSSHERSHLLCAFGMSPLPKGTPCYALLWEGVIGAFYKLDSELNVTKLGDVIPEPGHRYALAYGLADPTFDISTAEFSRLSDAGKLMALASFSKRDPPSVEEEEILALLMQDCPHLKPKACEALRHCRHYNVGLDDPAFRNFAGIVSDRIFDRFYQFSEAHLKRGMPLLITGGCGLNCDWNTKWKETGFFSDVFVPPVANDSGSAIGTAIDAQFHFTGNPKIEWDIYAGRKFEASDIFDVSLFDVCDTNYAMIADMLDGGLIIGWVNGRYEIGPRALGNRSILAEPFRESTRVRLNKIKQREQFRPIAPVCLGEDAAKWFGCDHPSPFMLYTQTVSTDALAAVTHVNGTARVQTVSSSTNRQLHDLLLAFRARTGYGVLCNTSLNFHGRGFINSIADLSVYASENNLDGFVVEGRSYFVKASSIYQEFRMTPSARTGAVRNTKHHLTIESER